MVINALEKFPKRIAGKKTWQYQAWLKLMADIKADGISSEYSFGIRTAKNKFIHHELLNYQQFYLLISKIRGETDIRDAILVRDFFNDGYVNSDNIFYLPKRLVQTYQELRKSQTFQNLGKSYRVVAGGVSGQRVTIGNFKTLEEAQNSYKKFKITTLTELFNIYQGFLPPHFCTRFQKILTTLNEGEN